MHTAAQDPWAELVRVTETMLRCAERGEWLELAALEIQRRDMIGTAPPLEAAARDTYAQAVRHILAVDQRTAALAQAGHADLAKQLQNIHAGRSAIQAYARQAR